jgi:hypothetical protein
MRRGEAQPEQGNAFATLRRRFILASEAEESLTMSQFWPIRIIGGVRRLRRSARRWPAAGPGARPECPLFALGSRPASPQIQ